MRRCSIKARDGRSDWEKQTAVRLLEEYRADDRAISLFELHVPPTPAERPLVVAASRDAAPVWVIADLFDVHAPPTRAERARIVAATQDGRPLVRAAAARLLGSIKARSALAILTDLMNDRTSMVRAGAVHGLGRLGSAAALRVVVDVGLHDTDELVHQAAAVVLVGRHDRRVLEYLEKVVADTRSEHERAWASQLLAQYGRDEGPAAEHRPGGAP